MTWTLHLGDCLEYMRSMPDGSVDAVVTDPPYGISLVPGEGKLNATKHEKIIGDDRPFDPSPFLGYKKVVVWGANNYAKRLPDCGAWLAWDKVTRNGFKLRIAEYEFAWTNATTRHRGFRHMWSGAYRDSERGTKYHPCQKPVALMKWCLDVAGVPEGATVFDPYCGSGSVGVACIQTGRNFIGCEISPEYHAIATRRLQEAENNLFAGATK